MSVVVGMGHDLVPGLGERFHGFRILVDPVSDDEEGRPDIVCSQDVDQLLRVLVSPG